MTDERARAWQVAGEFFEWRGTPLLVIRGKRVERGIPSDGGQGWDGAVTRAESAADDTAYHHS